MLMYTTVFAKAMKVINRNDDLLFTAVSKWICSYYYYYYYYLLYIIYYIYILFYIYIILYTLYFYYIIIIIIIIRKDKFYGIAHL